MENYGKVAPIDRTIAAVQSLQPRQAQPGDDAAASFVSLLRQQLDEMIELQHAAERMQQQLAAGQVTDINQVVLAVQKADLALNFALQLRNKVLEAYQEISRTQI